jgi:dUTP pyrophosphatase
MIEVKIVNESANELPQYATEGAAGMDIRANISESYTLQPGKRFLFPTGIRIQLPVGYECQVRPRSGWAHKTGVAAAFGTIDSDYTGIIGVNLFNFGDEPITINNGDRIAQLVVSKYEQVQWLQVEALEATARGDNGFGHTGIS